MTEKARHAASETVFEECGGKGFGMSTAMAFGVLADVDTGAHLERPLLGISGNPVLAAPSPLMKPECRRL